MSGAGTGSRGVTGRRTQAERDAASVEAMYAVVTAAVLGAAGFLVVTTPVMAGAAHGSARDGWVSAAVIVAAGLFFGRIVLTLHRFERRARERRQAPPPYPWDPTRSPAGHGDDHGSGYGRGRADGGGDGGTDPGAAPLAPVVTPYRPRRVVRQAASSGAGRRGARGGADRIG